MQLRDALHQRMRNGHVIRHAGRAQALNWIMKAEP